MWLIWSWVDIGVVVVIVLYDFNVVFVYVDCVMLFVDGWVMVIGIVVEVFIVVWIEQVYGQVVDVFLYFVIGVLFVVVCC